MENKNNPDENNLQFKQLSKEIVYYIQNNSEKTEQCIKFVLYELNLRCISKDFLTKISRQIEP